MAYSQFRYAVRLSLEGRPCIIVGGGRVALRKAVSLLDAGAAVTVIAPRLDDGFRTLGVAAPHLRFLERPYRAGDLKGAFLVIAATDRRDINHAVVEEALRLSCLVNAADDPSAGNFSVPGTYAAGAVRFSVSTGGNPRFTHLILGDLAKQYGPDFGAFSTYLDTMRDRVKELLPDPDSRRRFWRGILTDDLVEEIRQGRLEQIKERIANEIDHCRAQS
ncbi:MAG: bifunctional precorrin-2 dehydrogenase/sirohydrochlorin ferrochelatase [Acidaminococcaceae bacterium]|nr:bifunctional precorrin-2 dehydrogenase/sirohydrochlorin ferrochelatase [Acidaminococcaceae bacterium]